MSASCPSLAEPGHAISDVAHARPSKGAIATSRHSRGEAAKQFDLFLLWSDDASDALDQLPPETRLIRPIPTIGRSRGYEVLEGFEAQGKRVETCMIGRYSQPRRLPVRRFNGRRGRATLVRWRQTTGQIGPEGLSHDIPATTFAAVGRLSTCSIGPSAEPQPRWHIPSPISSGKALSRAPDRVLGYAVPGDAIDKAALGYLHANCGNCHSDTGNNPTYPKYVTRLLVSNATVESTWIYKTTVDVPHTWSNAPTDLGMYRIEGGNAANSELYYRTGIREKGQMPPLATKIVDDDGRALLKQWIDRLPPPGGIITDAGDGG